jgi:ubiquitin-like protein Pup
MSEQIQKEKPEQKQEAPLNDGDAKGLSPESKAKVDKAFEGMDALLDEIDELLGSEAQSAAMVEGFIQRGGE